MARCRTQPAGRGRLYLTNVRLGTGGFGYTAFVVDAYAGLIPGWECSMVKDTGFVERALRHAATFRARQGHPFSDTIHHSDYAEVCVKPRNRETACLGGLAEEFLGLKMFKT